LQKKIKKKKNKIVPLLVLVGIMAVLAAVYVSLSAANDRREAEEAAAANADTTIMLAEMDASTITSLSYRYGDQEFITLDQSGGAWKWSEDALFPLNQTTVASMASAIARIGAMRTVDGGEAADYGLENPTCEIRVTYNGNTTYKYAIGDYNSFAGGYYFRDDDGSFYIIASGLLPYFQKDMDDLITLDTALATTADSVVSFTVNKDGVSTEVTEEDTVGTMYDQFCELDLLDWVDYYADSEEMTSYGIDGAKTLTLTYSKDVSVSSDTSGQTTKVNAAYTIRFGDTVDGMVYYSPADSKIVYQISEDVYAALMG